MHEMCEGCKWAEYPICKQKKRHDGSYKRIDNLVPNFVCGSKNTDEIIDRSLQKTNEELLEEKILELEARINALEGI